jgi:hypothetical protein
MKNRCDFFCKTLPVANIRPGTNSPRAHRARYLKNSQGTCIFVYALRSQIYFFLFLIWCSTKVTAVWVRHVLRTSSMTRISNEPLKSSWRNSTYECGMFFPGEWNLHSSGYTQSTCSQGGGPCEGFEKRWRTTTTSVRGV